MLLGSIVFIFLASNSWASLATSFSCFPSQLSDCLASKLRNVCVVSQANEGAMPVLQLSSLKERANLPALMESCFRDAKKEVSNRRYTKDGKVLATRSLDVCLRGQRDSRRPLVSGWDRLTCEDRATHLLAYEIPHAQSLHNLDPLTKLSYLQHYGAPTTLLDWTKSLATAFYYAAAKFRYEGKCDRTAAMFVLDPYGLGEKYRLSRYMGIRVGGMALSRNFDTVVRAEYPFAHSHFELLKHPAVERAARRDGIVLPPDGDLDGILCARGTEMTNLSVRDVLSGPVPVIPMWAKGNQRVRVLQSVFTVDGIMGQVSHDAYAPYVLKLSLDESCVASILENLSESRHWKLIDSLAQSEGDREFNERQDDFNKMMSGGF